MAESIKVLLTEEEVDAKIQMIGEPVSYTHLRAHET